MDIGVRTLSLNSEGTAIPKVSCDAIVETYYCPHHTTNYFSILYLRLFSAKIRGFSRD